MMRRILSNAGSRLRLATTLATALRATSVVTVAAHQPACFHHCSTAGDEHIASVRKLAPAWKGEAVVNGAFKSLSNKDFAGSWHVLFFYPLDFTFVCPTEIIAFSDRVKEFDALKVKVAAVSVDSKFSHLAWINLPRAKGGLGEMAIPVIADVSKRMSRAFGVLIDDAADGDDGVALRGTFIIDPEGVVRSLQINDLPVGRSVDEVLRLVQAFQSNERDGEVCPANWHKGAKTMKASPAGSQEYFSATWGKK